MPLFQPGNMVVHVPSQSIGTVVQVLPVRGGMQLYQVRFDKRSNVVPEQQLVEYLDLTDEFERCRRGLFGTNEQFVIKNTTFKISNQSINSIATMMASKTDFKPYQYIPLLKFLYSANKRLLVADEVGLGKTIEAGHIMMELKARHELRNVLIICPNSLIMKWKDEMLERFDLRFKAYGTGMASDFRNDLQAEHHSMFAIVNYEKVRDQRLQNLIKENNITFDLVVCDEAHKMRNHTAATHEGARAIVEKARAALFLTATPVMTSENNLFWLLNILDKQAYDNQYLFGNALRENAPLVKALSRLGDMNTPVADILDELDSAEIESTYSVGDIVYKQTQTIHDKFAKVPVYNHIIAQKEAVDSYELRVSIQSDISSLNVLNGVFTRNRKKEVFFEEPQAQREAKPCYVPFTREERELYEQTLNEYKFQHTYIDNDGNERWEEGYALGYTTLERQLASSLYAAIEGPTEALKHKDAKFEALHSVYKEVVAKNGRKIIVFAVYNATIEYLKARFSSDGIPVCVINSALDVDARRAELKEFKTNPDKCVLIASEVGSEGLDMQFCDALVNYDLPWNPMVVEQRIGRIDRIGQKSSVINIYNMVMQDTIHEKIYYRLLDRINIFKSCIGDLEAILDSEYEPGKTLHDALDELPRQLYRLDLSDEEKEAQRHQIEMAIVHEKNNLDNVSETLTDTLTNDVYFRNEIHSMKRNYRYVTAEEIHNYIESIIRDELTTCTLLKHEEGLYSFQIPRSNLSAVTSFLTANEPLNNDRRVDYNRFISSIRGLSEIFITFDRDYARENPSVTYIDPFHPLVMACMNYYSKRESTDNTFEFALSSSAFADLKTISKGEYFLGIYVVELTKTLYGSRQIQHLEIPLLYDVQNDSLIKGKEETMRMMGEAQQNAQIYHSESPIRPEVIDRLQNIFPAEIESMAQDMRDDAEMHLESSKQMEINRLTEYYTNRIRQQERVVEELRSLSSYKDEDSVRRYRTLPMQETNLAALQHDFDEAIGKVSSGNVELSNVPALITLSHIVVR